MKNKQESNSIFQCPICGNTDIHSIDYLNGRPYFRRCASFRGNEAIGDYPLCDKADYHLEYELTKDQQMLSDQLVDNFRYGINTLIHAVCESAKTRKT